MRNKTLNYIIICSVAAALLAAGVFALLESGKVSPSTPALSQAAAQGSPAANPTPEPGAKLTVWENAGFDLTYIQQYCVPAFNALYPDVKIAAEPVNYDDAAVKMTLPGGDHADVFAAPHSQIADMVSEKLILPVDGASPNLSGDCLPEAVDAVSWQGQTWGYPLAIDTYALLYNYDLLKEPPKTWADIKTLAKKFNDPANGKYALMFNVSMGYYSYPFIAGYGTPLFGPGGNDRTSLGFDTPAAIEGMTFFKSIHDDIMPIPMRSTVGDSVKLAFKAGKVAMILDGPWDLVDIGADAHINVYSAPLPTMPNGRAPVTFADVRALFVSSQTKYPNAARLFAEFAASQPQIGQRLSVTAEIPPYKSALTAFTDGKFRGVINQLQNSVPTPKIPEMKQFWALAPDLFSSVWDGTAQPGPALQDMAEKLKAAYGK